MIDDQVVLTNAGERMVVGNTWSYWAHLSIYRFVLPIAQGGNVLDAGSGAGYGAAYLARHGAKVRAVDAGEYAVEYSRRLYADEGVAFDVVDLNKALPFDDCVFDLVFSSNVFEHVGNVDGLAAECARVMKSDGVVVIAVPPICTPKQMAEDIANRFHVHHIPPTAWHAKLKRFFVDVQCHAHIHKGRFRGWDGFYEQVALPPELVTITDEDFEFPAIGAGEMLALDFNITAIFVCRGRRLPFGPETLTERTPREWQESEVAARIFRAALDAAELSAANLDVAVALAEDRRLQVDAATARADLAEEGARRETELREALDKTHLATVAEATGQLSEINSRLMALQNSWSWRLTAPLRILRSHLWS